MTMITLSKLQAWPYGAANCGEDGAPKTCKIGGVDRVRQSSQSVKKAIRTESREHFPITDTALRTRPYEAIARHILESDTNEYSIEDVYRAVQVALRNAFAGHRLMMFMPTTAIERIANIITGSTNGEPNMDFLITVAAKNKIDTSKEARKYGGTIFDATDFDITTDSNKEEEKTETEKKLSIPKDLKPQAHDIATQMRSTIEYEGNLDIAMFGRMVADDKNLNVDAAISVAHSYGVTASAMNGPEIDFFVAVDDNPIGDTAVSGMLGKHKRSSDIMFTQAWIDLKKLIDNLTTEERPREEAEKLATHACGVFIRTFAQSYPRANRTNSGDPSTPSLVMVNVAKSRPHVQAMMKCYTKPVSTVTSDGPIIEAHHRLFNVLQEEERMWEIEATTHVLTGHPETVPDRYTEHTNLTHLINAATEDIK